MLRVGPLRSHFFRHGCSLRRTRCVPASRPRRAIGGARALEELPFSLLRLQLFPLLFHRGLFVKAPLLQLPEHSVKLEFLFQGPHRLFDVPGLNPYLQDRFLPPLNPPRSPLPPPEPGRPLRSVFG